MLSTNTIQEVRDLNIFDVVSKYVTLKKAGTLYKGCCPFHGEKTPSFTVNTQKQYFKCFGCGEGGDAIAFVMKHDKLDFIPAIERIARDHNIFLKYEEQTEEQIKKEEQKKTLFDATAYAGKYFIQSLANNGEGIEYLSKRGITESEIKTWNLGYADSSGFIKKHAEENGQIQLFQKASLISANAQNTVHYDFFKNRIIIPICDTQNRILSFSGRALGDEQPKYLNGRETDIFSKSKILFGANKYKKPYSGCNFSVLVEGYFDIISLHRVGVTNSLASNGTALSKEQAKELKKKGDEVIIFYDNDKAGLKSCLQNIDTLLQEGLVVKVYTSPVGKDADDLCRLLYAINPENSVAEMLYQVAQDAIEFKVSQLLKNANTPAEISEAKNAISETIFKIKNETLRNEYLKFVSKNFKFKEAEIKNILKNIEETEKKKAQDSKSKDAKFLDEQYPDWFDNDHKKHFNKFHFTERIHNEETGYYFPDSSWFPTHQTNFVIQPLYMIKSYLNPRRMVEVFGFNKLTNHMISEVIDFDEKQILKREQFESRLAQQSPFITFEGYNNTHHKRLANKLLFQFKDCYELSTLGFQPEQFWAFSNVCFEFPTAENPKGLQREYNDFGVVEIGKTNFLSEAKNKRAAQLRADNNNPYENDLYFVYKKSPLNFSQWSALFDEVYSNEKSWIGTAFIVSTIFRDLILTFTKIPHLHCYGEKGSGKSVYAESIFHIFFAGTDSEGKLYKPYNLTGGGTPYSFHNRLERFRACPQILNEYDDTNILPEFFDAIKASFDGEGRERGMGIKGKTETMRRNATLILCGQKIGNRDDNSVLTRSVTIEFKKPIDGYTEIERELMKKLEDLEHEGLSSIIIEILSHRIHFKKRFAELYLQTVTALQKKVAEIYQKVETRIIKSLAALQLSYFVMSEVVQLPLNAEQLNQQVFNKAIEMHAHLQSTDGLSEFWKVIEFLLDRDEIEEDWHFKIRAVTNVKLRKTVNGATVDDTIHFTGEKKLLYIRIKELHQFYCLHVNRTSKNEKPLSEKTIITYMSSQNYFIGLCPGTGFKSATKNKSKDSTSCYVLDYDKIGINLETTKFEDERIQETITGIVHKINDTTGDKIKFVIKCTKTIKAEPIDRTVEEYTNCWANAIELSKIKIDTEITVKGLVSINSKQYRNMDVVEVIEKDITYGII